MDTIGKIREFKEDLILPYKKSHFVSKMNPTFVPYLHTISLDQIRVI